MRNQHYQPPVFPVIDGVHQGGILTPMSFKCMYQRTEHYTQSLYHSDIRSSLGDKFIKHKIYAGDLCVISSSDLQTLFNICI